MMLKKTSIAIFVLTLSLAALCAITPDQLQQLAGKSPDKIQASQYAQVYQDAFSYLVEQMDQSTNDARYGHQIMLQNICLYADRPDAEPQRLAMAKALAGTLENKTMTPEIRYWVLLQIERTGKAEVLGVLTKLLGSSDKIEKSCVRAALEKNPAPQATEILVKALATTQDEVFASGLVSSLGNRQDPKALEAIGRQINHKNRTIAAAAVTALVKINTPDAVIMLSQKLTPADPAAGTIAKGLVEIAAVSAAPKANAIYTELYGWSCKVNPASRAYSIRKAALIGLAVNDSADVDKMILADFKVEDPAVKSMAIAAAAVAKSSIPAKTMAENSDQLDNVLLSQLITMLTRRGESSVITAIQKAMKSNDSFVLLAVIDPLSQMETQQSASLLLELTRHDDIQVSKYARENLIKAANKHIDELLRTQADTGQDKQRAAVIELLGERKTPNVTEQLFKYAQSDNTIIYESAFKAIGLSASADKIPVLCGMAKTTTTDKFKMSALSAINLILRNSRDQKAAYAIILGEIKTAGEDQKVDLITTLKMSGDRDAMQYCLGLLDDAEGKAFQTPIPQTALKMLSSWSDPMPAQALIERAKTSQHKSAYAEAALELARNMLRYNKNQARKIATDVKALNMSETMNESADKIIKIR